MPARQNVEQVKKEEADSHSVSICICCVYLLHKETLVYLTVLSFPLSLVNYFQGCTVGSITQVTVSDNAFPFGYDLTQFNLCLDIPVLKDRLDSICQKVDDNDFQTVILRKLNEVHFAYRLQCEIARLLNVRRTLFLEICI